MNIATTNSKLGNNDGSSQNFNWKGQNQNHRESISNRSRGRGGRTNSNNTRPVCQVCGKICYFRYDHGYMGSIPNATNQNSAVVNNSGNHPAYMATSNTISDPNWYMNNMASNHITHDSANIDYMTSAYGKEKIKVGNGEKNQCS